ncbi:MAG: hypothetical protein J0M24_17845 [Verrucomicrobia bacterium]|nr:hypothetical protein [Verrucomicrobiota bacterium]
MYPFNASPGFRPAAPVFATFGDESGVDTRHGQFILGWDTASQIASQLPAQRYRVTAARLTLRTLREGSFLNDSTEDPWASYLPTNSVSYRPDTDPGRPVELFGAGFRNGFTAESYLEDSPFGSSSVARRNAFAAGYNERGELVDVSNNVGKTNSEQLPFVARPFAVGTIAQVPNGEPVPAGAAVVFEFNLIDPFVVKYLQTALSEGRLRLSVTWLGESGGLGGSPQYPDFATRENILQDPPRLELAGVVFGEEDSDSDGLSDDWERHFWGNLEKAAGDDSDADGRTNLEEWGWGTDPTVAISVVRLNGLNLRKDGRVRLEFTAGSAGRYVVEWSDDLRTWTRPAGEFRFPAIRAGEWTSFDSQSPSAGYFRLRPE